MLERYAVSGFRKMLDVSYSPGVSAAVFTLFVVIGCAYIVVAKLEGIGQFYVTFVPVVVMLAYALLICLARPLRLRDDQSGDNLYYMGFLLTLTSLGVSLYQFTATGAAEEIVQNFGIAIGSTITGIGLRVIFNQMRRDPIEVERIMRLELAEAARRVRRELDSTVVEFGYFRRSTQQAAADSFRQVASTFDEVADKLVSRLEEVASNATRPLETASRRSGEAIGEQTKAMVAAFAATTQQLAAETERLSKSAVAISAALDEVAAKLALMQTPDRVVEVRLDPLAQALAHAINRLTAQSDAQVAATKDALEAAKIAAKSSSASIVALRQVFDSNSATNRTALEAATKIIITMTQILDEFKTDAKGHAEILRHMLDRTDGAIRTFTDVLGRSGAEMLAQSNGLREMLPAMEASAQTLATAAERMADVADDMCARQVKPKWEAIE
ncbi:MAG TPA: hypothetical protein VEK55_02785 [Xanthobacteraceae bacterium]|nr:hypothetical protein [Xanthobacteraceae bacterium]